MNIFDHVGQLISRALEQLQIEVADFGLDHPGELSHGDVSSNIALVLGKKLKTNPLTLAEDIARAIPADPYIDRVTAAAPGFVNFTLSPKFFEESVQKISADGDAFGSNAAHAGKKILVEHSSPNLFKPFHVGHVMNNAIGESISRLAAFSGATVTKMSYPSDVSLGIGKAVYALFTEGAGKLDELPDLSAQLAFLGDCYVKGTKLFDESEEVQKQVRKITEIIYEQTPGIELDAYQKGKDITLTYFKDITARLGSQFDSFIYESEAGAVGSEIVREHIGRVFTESDGAVIYEGERDGLHTRVFINKEGYPTYEAKDIGLLSLKFERFSPDTSIVVTDRQQKPYYEVVLAAAGKLEKAWQMRTVHKTHGRMSFKGKKMSSRLGGIPTAADVLSSVEDEVKEKMKGDVTPEKVDMITIAALKFTILKAMAGKDIDFDPETSLSFEGDSGPYLQYTFARTNSILQKAADIGLAPGVAKEPSRIPTDVERYAYRFPDVVALAVNDWSPHHIATYLLELARAFNSWYGVTKIVDHENANVGYHLSLTRAVGQILKNGLTLLGIKAPERM